MICGLFSSFDPGILREEEFMSIKWLWISLILLMFGWQMFLKFNGMSIFFKNMVDFFLNVISDISEKYKNNFLFFFSIFLFVLLMNLWGLIPYFFSSSSHLVVNLSISLPMWMSGILFSLSKSVKSFLSHFVPFGSPSFLWPLLVFVEGVSLFIRPFSLAIRLMSNMMAGHLIINLIGVFSCSKMISIFSSLFITMMIVFFEFCVAWVQAYVFINLISLYWKESEF